MAELKTNIIVNAGSWFTNTRVNYCMAQTCKFCFEAECSLKNIMLDSKGACRFYEHKGIMKVKGYRPSSEEKQDE